MLAVVAANVRAIAIKCTKKKQKIIAALFIVLWLINVQHIFSIVVTKSCAKFYRYFR